MNQRNPLHAIGAALLLGAALFVGSGCSNGTAADITGTGSPGKSASDEGEVEGFGSVIVNGTRYATDAETKIFIEGEESDESALQLGMVVEIEVAAEDLRRDGAPARRISFRALLQGSLEAIDRNARSLRLLQTTVFIDELSRLFDSNGQRIEFDDLQLGDTVQLSGFRRQNGDLTASFVRQTSPGPEGAVVRGRVSQLDSANARFQIHRLGVDYGAAASLELIDELENGDLVEVVGQPNGSGRLQARRVTELRDADESPPERQGVHGLVTTIDPASSCPALRFTIGEREVQASSQTLYEGGSCADIAVDRRIGAVGQVVNQVLQAEAIVLPPPVNALVHARVEAVFLEQPIGGHPPGCQLRVFGDLILQVGQNARQGQPGSAGAQGRGFGCRDVRSGDAVSAVGFFESGSPDTLQVALLRPAPRQDQVPPGFPEFSVLAGELQSISAINRQFRLLGTLVQTDDQTDYPDSSELAFYTATEAGDFVAVIGEWTGGQIRARAVVRGFRPDFD